MKPDIIGFKKTVSTAIIAGVFGTNLFAATNAKLTVYQKDTEPKVFALSSIKNVTLGLPTAIKPDLANKIVYSIRFLPSSGVYKIRISGDPKSYARLKIFNLAGREFVSERFVLGTNGSRIITLPAMANGLYIVQMKNGLKTITQRINVSR